MDSEHSPNVQLTTISNLGRVFAEHNGASNTNEFTAEWQAPDSNSGDVSFYVAGIGANSNGGSSGDHAPTPIRVTFSEVGTSSSNDLHQSADLEIFPNPASDIIEIRLENEQAYSVQLYDLAGRQLIQAVNSTQLSVSDLPNGTYFIELTSLTSNRQAVEKIMVLK